MRVGRAPASWDRGAQQVQRPRGRRKPGAWGQTGDADREDPGTVQGSELTTAHISQLAGGQQWGREVTSPRYEIGGGDLRGWSAQTRTAGPHWETVLQNADPLPSLTTSQEWVGWVGESGLLSQVGAGSSWRDRNSCGCSDHSNTPAAALVGTEQPPWPWEQGCSGLSLVRAFLGQQLHYRLRCDLTEAASQQAGSSSWLADVPHCPVLM